MIKAALFDADGVLALPEEFFSHVYASSRGLDTAPFERFFREQFQAALLGRADLKDLIAANNDVWRRDGDTDELLQMWFESENVKNEPLLKVIRGLRLGGMACFLATNQEKYRGQYLREVMFPDMFDDYFVSCDLGAKKPDAEFYELVIASLKKSIPGIEPAQIAYFDDTPDHVESAQNLGLSAYLYESPAQVQEILAV